MIWKRIALRLPGILLMCSVLWISWWVMCGILIDLFADLVHINPNGIGTPYTQTERLKLLGYHSMLVGFGAIGLLIALARRMHKSA
jgi:hypothetical protein